VNWSRSAGAPSHFVVGSTGGRTSGGKRPSWGQFCKRQRRERSKTYIRQPVEKRNQARAVRVTALFVFRQLADGFQTVGHPMSNSLTSLDKYFIMRLDTNGFLS